MTVFDKEQMFNFQKLTNQHCLFYFIMLKMFVVEKVKCKQNKNTQKCFELRMPLKKSVNKSSSKIRTFMTDVKVVHK